MWFFNLIVTALVYYSCAIAEKTDFIGLSEFCGRKEREGKSDAYCEIKWLNRNETINTQIDEMTRDPILPYAPFDLNLLPCPLLPVDPEGTMSFTNKAAMEFMYSKALNITGVEAVKHQKFKDEDEHEVWTVKHEYWKQLWCLEADDQCTSLEARMMMLFKTWDHVRLEAKFKEQKEKKGMLILGQRLLFELEADPDKREQCIHTHHYPAVGCDARGDHCKKWGWDQDFVQCDPDCLGKACLRIGANGNYLA